MVPSRVGEDPGGRHRRGLRLRRAVCGSPPNFLLLPSARFGTLSILLLQAAAAAPAPARSRDQLLMVPFCSLSPSVWARSDCSGSFDRMAHDPEKDLCVGAQLGAPHHCPHHQSGCAALYGVSQHFRGHCQAQKPSGDLTPSVLSLLLCLPGLIILDFLSYPPKNKTKH